MSQKQEPKAQEACRVRETSSKKPFHSVKKNQTRLPRNDSAPTTPGANVCCQALATEGVSDSRRDMQRKGPCPVRLSTREREKGTCCEEGSHGRLTFGPTKLDLKGVPSFKEAEWMS